MDLKEKFEYAWKKTEILRPVERKLFTFGDTHLPYIVLAPSLVNQGDTVVREGEVVAERPLIFTPASGHAYFEGFGEKEKEVAKFIVQRFAYIPPYKYRNSSQRLYVSSMSLAEIAGQFKKKLDQEDNSLVVIIKALADAWEVSVMKYVAERMVVSLPSNIQELKERGFLEGKLGGI